ncbi:recombinase family protein [Streptomyces sp. NPDC048419]|uniref:recombinase family protein n=1 Tax=Streptomyces sp. NPDC048419 TaxID=3365547 RepID=UPI0037199BF9
MRAPLHEGQWLDRQTAALDAAGCVRVFADKKSRKNAEREELWKCFDYLHPGDTLVVPSLDRLGRSLPDPIAIVSRLPQRDIGFHSLHEVLLGSVRTQAQRRIALRERTRTLNTAKGAFAKPCASAAPATRKTPPRTTRCSCGTRRP